MRTLYMVYGKRGSGRSTIINKLGATEIAEDMRVPAKGDIAITERGDYADKIYNKAVKQKFKVVYINILF